MATLNTPIIILPYFFNAISYSLNGMQLNIGKNISTQKRNSISTAIFVVSFLSFHPSMVFSLLPLADNLTNNRDGDAQLASSFPSVLTFLQYHVEGSQATRFSFCHAVPGTTVGTETEKNPIQTESHLRYGRANTEHLLFTWPDFSTLSPQKKF